jgi:hypothetical protein
MSAAYRKAYYYAYPTSEHARRLGYAETGCYFIGRETRREDGSWSPAEVWPGSEGEVAASWHDCGPLRDLYAEIDAPVSPWCMSSPLHGRS